MEAEEEETCLIKTFQPPEISYLADFHFVLVLLLPLLLYTSFDSWGWGLSVGRSVNWLFGGLV